MLRTTFLPALFCSTLFLFTQCRSAQKMVETGNYDSAIDFCVDKLSGKKKKPTEWVQALEIAFKKATERDMRAAEALIAEGRTDNWERIHQIHQQIAARQHKVLPLVPLRSKDGYEARFLFVNIEGLEFESRTKAADYLYTRAEQHLARARKGDKAAAREAFYLLADLEKKFFAQYKDKETLQREAIALGTVHILFEVKNETNRLLPRDFNERILAISKQDLDSRWKSYHLRPEPGFQYDYKTVFQLTHIDISPERIQERLYTDEKEIHDGWEYEYDQRGNVKKDSLGNDIKHKRWVLVRANVIEVLQTKAARIAGQLTVTDTDGSQRLDTRPVATEILFEHYASTFNGDPRALCDQTRARIGNRPAPFPSDEDLLVQAADRLKPNIYQELKNSRALQ